MKRIIIFFFFFLFQIQNVHSAQNIKIDVVQFERFFPSLTTNYEPADKYASKYVDIVRNIKVSDVSKIVKNQNQDQKARALIMLTILSLNKNISDMKVTDDFEDVAFVCKCWAGEDGWLNLILRKQ